MKIVKNDAAEGIIQTNIDMALFNAIRRTMYYVVCKALKVEMGLQNRGQDFILINKLEYLPVKRSVPNDATMKLAVYNHGEQPLVVTTRSFIFKNAKHDDVFPKEYYICMLFRDQFINATMSIVEGTCSGKGETSKFQAINKLLFDTQKGLRIRLVNNGTVRPVQIFMEAATLLSSQLDVILAVHDGKKETSSVTIVSKDKPYMLELRLKAEDKQCIPFLLQDRLIDMAEVTRTERFDADADLPEVCWYFYFTDGVDRKKMFKDCVVSLTTEIAQLVI